MIGAQVPAAVVFRAFSEPNESAAQLTAVHAPLVRRQVRHDDPTTRNEYTYRRAPCANPNERAYATSGRDASPTGNRSGRSSQAQTGQASA